jgi:hypothetical protein
MWIYDNISENIKCGCHPIEIIIIYNIYIAHYLIKITPSAKQSKSSFNKILYSFLTWPPSFALLTNERVIHLV